jgi:hypothetical protein
VFKKNWNQNSNAGIKLETFEIPPMEFFPTAFADRPFFVTFVLTYKLQDEEDPNRDIINGPATGHDSVMQLE